MSRPTMGPYFADKVHTAERAGLRFTHASYPAGARLPRHGHERPYLCVVASGRFEERLPLRRETCVAGMAVWNPTCEEHEDVFGESGAHCLNVEFGDAWGDRLTMAGDRWTPARGAETTWLASRIMREMSAPDSASILALEGLVCALLGEVSRTDAHERPRSRWVLRVRDRLHAEYLDPPSVAELAKDAGVHRSHFARAFHRVIGCTVAEYVRRRRVEWAAHQLLTRRHTLTELSLLAGFADQAHFTRVFKRIMGVTPGTYRATTH